MIRDLYGAADGTVLAVGDGAAELRTDGPSTDRWAWAPQLGTTLTQLNAMAVVSSPGWLCPEPLCGWAVGESDLIARYGGGCWSEATYGQREVALSSLDLAAASTALGEGWAVGRTRAASGDHAALRVLRQVDEEAAWFADVSSALSLPPLSDIQVFLRGVSREVEIWAVGTATDGTGRFIQAQPSAGGAWRWQSAQQVPGEPRELAMAGGGSSGWAFGHAPEQGTGQSALTGWHYDSAFGWQPASFQLAGRDLVDVYLMPLPDDEPEIWVGASPGPIGEPVLYRFTTAAEPPAAFGARPAEMSAADDGGSRAIASLADGRLLYAWGDDVWLLDRAADSWALVRRRLRLVDLAWAAQGWWLLAESSGGSELLAFDGTGLTAVTAADGASVVQPRLNAVATGGTQTWAVGNAGASLMTDGAAGRWRWMTSSDSAPVDLLDVVVAGNGVAWAAGVNGDGHGGLWRFDGTSWRLEARTSRPGALRSLAALPDAEGTMVAVGDGAVLALQTRCRGDSGRCRTEHESRGDLFGVAVVDADTVWAIGHQYLATLSRGAGWRPELAALRRADGNLALRNGSRLSGIAASAPHDVWATYRCCRPEGALGGEHSVVLHFDGTAWEPVNVVNTPISEVAVRGDGHTREAWFVGDWSTILEYRYEAD